MPQDVTVTNARTGTTLTLIEMSDTGVTLRYNSSAPTRIPDFPKHVHEIWEEDFEIVSGQGRYWIDGDWHDISAGERMTHARHKPHIHPMNASDAPFEMIQTVRTASPEPEKIKMTFAVLFSLFDRHAQGRVTLLPNGYPVNPLYFAALGRVLGQSGSFDATIPRAVQNVSSATMGRLAFALGVNPIDDKWL